jgi:RNA polymerase sigma-70 factor (ECF subfamily)
LLRRVRENDESAWQRLARLYTPQVYGWCRHLGVPAQDAPDIVQEVFVAVHRRIGAFTRNRGRGSFRAWLWTITRNKILDHSRRRDAGVDGVGGSGFQQWMQAIPEREPEPATADAQPDGSSFYRRALELVQAEFEPRTWQAFWRSTVDEVPSAEVAEELGMSTGAVRKARFRVMHRLREELEGLID